MVNSSGPEKDRLKAWQTAEEAELGLVASDVLAVWQWWLDERRLVPVCQQVKAFAVCQSVGRSSKTVDFQRSLKVLICCVGRQ